MSIEKILLIELILNRSYVFSHFSLTLDVGVLYLLGFDGENIVYTEPVTLFKPDSLDFDVSVNEVYEMLQHTVDQLDANKLIPIIRFDNLDSNERESFVEHLKEQDTARNIIVDGDHPAVSALRAIKMPETANETMIPTEKKSLFASRYATLNNYVNVLLTVSLRYRGTEPYIRVEATADYVDGHIRRHYCDDTDYGETLFSSNPSWLQYWLKIFRGNDAASIKRNQQIQSLVIQSSRTFLNWLNEIYSVTGIKKIILDSQFNGLELGDQVLFLDHIKLITGTMKCKLFIEW